ncbi:MAG TPA: arsenosugar biosynthesis radical SAM (seleno)protein ArsS [Thermoanaerobaculia bacterium]|nr:arsenosugar biosynthesis radical SAM (seleno)protein ArsS [Thermoanaerobaculia bacterium]
MSAKPRITSLSARHSPLSHPTEQLALLDRFAPFATELTPNRLEIFQINTGKLCNMTCRHCHVDAGPDRTDAMMSRTTIDACLRALDQTAAHTVDITGGAPELHPDFRYLVESARARGKHIIDRCNLSVLLMQRNEGLAQWLANHDVEIVASLPHYRQRSTDAQRGDGAFDKSIEALRLLNSVGYGKGDPAKVLSLMMNPAGAFLAPRQAEVEPEWKVALARDFGIEFDRLLALNNMPISRFLEWLVDSNNLDGYMDRLIAGYNESAVAGLMCRNTISVSWDGRLFDCDFNQMLELDAEPEMTIENFDFEAWQKRQIVTRPHCYGCTAGAGSSCGGSTTS